MVAGAYHPLTVLAAIAALGMLSAAAPRGALGAPAPAAAGTPAATGGARPVQLDRVVVRWISTDTGGPNKPQFILARELGFEARIEALGDGYRGADGYADKHVRAAIQRHITETMLASLPLYTNPTPKQRAETVKLVGKYAEAARLITEQRVGGRQRLIDAARAEGIIGDEIDALLRRQAQASLYLDRMVAPMLEPTDAEVREVHQHGESPFTDRPFEQPEVRQAVRRWLVSSRVAAALGRYYRNAQARLVVRLIEPG